MNTRRTLVPAVIPLLALTGCAVRPAPRPAAPAVPAAWPLDGARGVASGAPPVERWWTTFHDPQLDSLLRRAAAANLDLRIAAARIREARAAVGLTGSAALPQVSASGAGARARQMAVGVLAPAGGERSVRQLPFESNLFQGLLEMSWEIDLFGRIRRGIQASEADLAGAREDRSAVLVAVLGDVAAGYAQVRGFQMRIAIARRNIDLQQETLRLTRALAQAGQVTARDVAQSEALLDSTRATLPALESALARSIHALSVLLGMEPRALEPELTAAPLPPIPPEVPVGLPSGLLERRPDIRRAAAQLAAADARIGQARANYFPVFSLTGSAGREAAELHQLTLGFSNVFSAGPSITIPVFTGGRLRANVAVQRARAEEAAGAYRATVLRALEETDNALTSYSRDQDRRDQLQRVLDADRDALHLSRIQYQAGLADFLTVLDAERTLLQTEDQLAVTKTDVVVDLVSLYKALGGGWSAAEVSGTGGE